MFFLFIVKKQILRFSLQGSISFFCIQAIEDLFRVYIASSYCSTSMQHYIEKHLLRILLNILLTPLEPPRRSRVVHVHRHSNQSIVVLLSFVFSSGWVVKKKPNPDENLEIFSPFPRFKFTSWILPALKCFQVMPESSKSLTSQPCLHIHFVKNVWPFYDNWTL